MKDGVFTHEVFYLIEASFGKKGIVQLLKVDGTVAEVNEGIS